MEYRFCGQRFVTVQSRSNKSHQRRLTGLIGTVDDIESLWIKAQQQIAPDTKAIDINFRQLHAVFLCQTALPATPGLVIGIILFRVVINEFRINICGFVKVAGTLPLHGFIQFGIKRFAIKLFAISVIRQINIV